MNVTDTLYNVSLVTAGALAINTVSEYVRGHKITVGKMLSFAAPVSAGALGLSILQGKGYIPKKVTKA